MHYYNILKPNKHITFLTESVLSRPEQEPKLPHDLTNAFTGSAILEHAYAK